MDTATRRCGACRRDDDPDASIQVKDDPDEERCQVTWGSGFRNSGGEHHCVSGDYFHLSHRCVCGDSLEGTGANRRRGPALDAGLQGTRRTGEEVTARSRGGDYTDMGTSLT